MKSLTRFLAVAVSSLILAPCASNKTETTTTTIGTTMSHQQGTGLPSPQNYGHGGM